MAEFRVATKKLDQNAKGNAKKLGRSKTSSCAEDVAKSTKKHANDSETEDFVAAIPVLDSTLRCFEGNKRGSKGLRKSLLSYKSGFVMPTFLEIENHGQSLEIADPLYAARTQLLNNHLKIKHQYLWLLQTNYNILFFGVGCKKNIMQEMESSLEGEDVLSIDGKAAASSGRILKVLLDTIWKRVLFQSESSLKEQRSNVDVYTRMVCDHLNKLYGRVAIKDVPVSAVIHASILNTSSVFETSSSSSSSSSSASSTILDNSNSNILTTAGAESSSSSSSSSSTTKAAVPIDAVNLSDVVMKKPRRSNTGILFSSLANGSKLADANWGGRYVNAKSRLYIMIHNIDCEALAHTETQECLAVLASCRSVSIIASADKFNCPMLWTADMLSKFNWAFQHVPTYTSFKGVQEYKRVQGGGSRSGLALANTSALEYILQSLGSLHRQVLLMLCEQAEQQLSEAHAAATSDKTNKSSSDSNNKIKSKKLANDIKKKRPLNVDVGEDAGDSNAMGHQQTSYSSSSSSSSSASAAVTAGYPISKLFQACVSRMIVKTLPELHLLLKELVEQRLVMFSSAAKMSVTVILPPDGVEKVIRMCKSKS